MRAVSLVPEPEGESFRLDAYLPYRLAAASGSVSRLLRRACEGRGLSIAQWRMMCVLAEGDCTLEQATGRGAFEPEAAVHALSDLCARRAAGKTPAGFGLTETGRADHQAIAPLALACEAALVSGLRQGEVRQLVRLLARLEAAAQRLSAD